jgi:hypothetical protein
MGLFDKGKSDGIKKAKQRKKMLDIERQIADLQLKKAHAADDRGSGEGEGEGGFWTSWYGKDWDF